MPTSARLALGALAAAAFGFLVAPILALIWRAAAGGAWSSLSASGVVPAVVLSLLTTLITTALTIAFGTPLAYAFARGRFRCRRLLNIVLELPIVLPPAVAGLGLLAAYGRRGVFGGALAAFGVSLPFTTAAVVVAQTFVSAPFYIRAAQIGFNSVPPDIEDAARVDGAAGWTLFWYITLPLASRALSAGLILSWARALGEFGATILFAGSLQGRTQTMPLLIYNVLERDLDAAVLTGVLLVGLALVALAAARAVARDDVPVY